MPYPLTRYSRYRYKTRYTRTPAAAAADSARRIRRQAIYADRRAAYAAVPYNVASRGLMRSAGELKSVDTASSLAVDTTGAILLLNGIALGDDINQRNGRQVTLRSITLRLQSAVTSGTGVDQQHRYLLVQDMQTNATALTIAQVLGSASTVAFPSLENRMRFKILLDEVLPLSASAESGSHTYRVHYRPLNIVVTFNSGSAGTVADIVTNSLYFICMGTSAAGATAGTVVASARVRYLDV